VCLSTKDVQVEVLCAESPKHNIFFGISYAICANERKEGQNPVMLNMSMNIVPTPITEWSICVNALLWRDARTAGHIIDSNISNQLSHAY